MLDRGELGELFFVSSSRVNLGLHQQDISVIWDLGPHDFSMLLYWLDEMPAKVRAVGRDSIVKGISDVAFVTLDFPSGLLANVELSWLAPSKLRRTVLVGSERMVVYDDGSTEPIKVFNHGVVYQDPGDVRGVPPVLPDRRHRLPEDRRRRADPARAGGLRRGGGRPARRPPAIWTWRATSRA